MTQPIVLLIGCGEMGGSLLKGWRTANTPFSFHVITPRQESVTSIDPSVPWFPTPAAYVNAKQTPDIILFAVRPALFPQIATTYQSLVQSHKPLVGSIMAGTNTQTFTNYFPAASGYFLAMPNLPVAVHEGVIGLAGKDLSPKNQEKIQRLFTPLGLATWLKDEGCFNDFTALSGCGPGIVYAFFHALLEAADTLDTGLENQPAVVNQLLQGSAAYHEAHPKSFEMLITQVAVSGGMTEQAINALKNNQTLTTLMKKALTAASHHGKTLGK